MPLYWGTTADAEEIVLRYRSAPNIGLEKFTNSSAIGPEIYIHSCAG